MGRKKEKDFLEIEIIRECLSTLVLISLRRAICTITMAFYCLYKI